MSRPGAGVVLGAAPGFREAPVTWCLVGINVLLWVVLEATGGSQDPENLLRFGAKSGRAILDGEWWRLVTPVFLHSGPLHVIANSIGLIAFGGTVERLLGRANYLGVYLLSGVLGNIASFWAGPALGVGASGAVFGVAGALAAYLLRNRRLLGSFGRQALTSVAFLIGVNLVFGFVFPGVDNAAHIGGLIGGAILGAALVPYEKRAPRPDGRFFIGAVARTAEVRPGPALSAAVIGAGVAAAVALAYAASLTYD